MTKSIKIEYTIQIGGITFQKGSTLNWNPDKLRYESGDGGLIATEQTVKTMPQIFKKINIENER